MYAGKNDMGSNDSGDERGQRKKEFLFRREQRPSRAHLHLSGTPTHVIRSKYTGGGVAHGRLSCHSNICAKHLHDAG